MVSWGRAAHRPIRLRWAQRETPCAIAYDAFVVLFIGDTGRRMWKVVPLPISVSNVNVPLCRSVTADLAIANPCPVPRPTSFVVKKGSKMLARTSSGMPGQPAPQNAPWQLRRRHQGVPAWERRFHGVCPAA
jgi:hypothetical protein